MCVNAFVNPNIWKWASIGTDSRNKDGVGVHQCHISLLSQNDGVTHEGRVVRVSSVGIQNDMRVDDMCRAGREIQLILNKQPRFKVGR